MYANVSTSTVRYMVSDINHPECKVDNSTHAVFFTACSANEQLHNKGTEAFHKWIESTSGAKNTPKTLSGGNDIDTLCLQAIHELMKDGASRKKLSPRDVRALKRAKTIDGRNGTNVSNIGAETGDATIAITRVDRLYVHTHANKYDARHLNGYTAGSAGHLARKAR